MPTRKATNKPAAKSTARRNTGTTAKTTASKTGKPAMTQRNKQMALMEATLKNVTANIMVADNDLNITYVNDAVVELLKDREAQIKESLPNFRADDLVGQNIDDFHKNPSHQRKMLAEMKERHDTKIELGGITFGLIANPIFDDKGNRLGTSVEWQDLTQQLEFEATAREAARVKTALDGATTNMMIANKNREIVYVNNSVMEMLRENTDELRKDLKHFDPDNLVGTNIDQFHKNPHKQINLLDSLQSPYETRIKVADCRFNLIAIPIFDEDGERIGTSVEWMDVTQETRAQEEIQALVDAAAAGDLTQRLDAFQYQGFMKDLSESLNKLLDTITDPIQEVLRVTKLQSENDLTAVIDKDYQGSFGQLKDWINEANRSMNSVLLKSSGAVEQVAGSVTQFRASSQELASSAEELSSAVEEVSSSLAETDSQVQSNSENANIANQLVSETAASANISQEKMQSMTEAMSMIEESSDDISKIIKVIDDIAFQTNLLALNAAVEAARAGQHGKGFAVVAQEVRNLAGRSAKAAKETADLIEGSRKRVKDGVSITDETREVLGDIVNKVLKVKDLVAEINAASEEQTRGISQINKAMSQISTSAESSSQQSMELASASDELTSLSEQLQEELGRFKLKAPENTMENLSQALPQGVSAEMFQKVMEFLQSNGQTSQGNGNGATKTDSKPAPSANKGSNASPSSVLPLDTDERGYGPF